MTKMDEAIISKVKRFLKKTGATLENTTVKDFALFLKANDIKFKDIVEEVEEEWEKRWNIGKY